MSTIPKKNSLWSSIRQLPSNVWTLGWISFLGDVSGEMLYPINPLFLQAVLGAPPSMIGLIEGVAEATASTLKTFSGYFSDRSKKRRPWIIWGYVLTTASKPLIALAHVWPVVLISRIIDRTGKGLRTAPRDALLDDSVEAGSRGLAFGFHRGLDSFGAVVGPLVALLFLYFYSNDLESLRWMYLVATIPGILCILLSFKIKDIKPKTTTNPPPFSKSFSSLPSKFKHYLYIWTLFSLTNSSDVFIILRAKELGASLVVTVLLYSAFNFVYTISSLWLGNLSDRLPRKMILSCGLFLFAFVYLGFALAENMSQVWCLYLMYGLYMGATDGVSKALAVDLVSPEIKGTSVGYLNTSIGLAALIASVVAGQLWTNFGSYWAFIYGACGAILSAILLLLFKK